VVSNRTDPGSADRDVEGAQKYHSKSVNVEGKCKSGESPRDVCSLMIPDQSSLVVKSRSEFHQ